MCVISSSVPNKLINIERRYPKKSGEPSRAPDIVVARKSSPTPTQKVQGLFNKLKEMCSDWTECGPMAGTTPELHEYIMRDALMGALFSGPSLETAAFTNANN